MKSLVLFLTVLTVAGSARIFGFFPVPSFSHSSVYRALLLELSRRGHQVVIVTTDPFGITNDNYTEIDIHDMSYDIWRHAFDFASKDQGMMPEVMMFSFGNFFTDLIDSQLSYEPIQKIINGSEKFDLVFVEYLLFPCLTAFSYKFQAPFIGMTSLDALVTGHRAVGNPVNPAYFADALLPYSDKKTFYQRLRTTLAFAFYYTWYDYYLTPKHDKLVKKHFGQDLPYVGDIDRNISLLLCNSDFVNGYPRPVSPSFIDVGGGHALHFTAPKPLPKDIQDFLDNAKDGVIYFSLGTNVKSAAMPESKRAVFLEAFKQIKQKVLWKWETEDLPGKPDNVKVGKWLPQTDILAHPNIRGFITQGGLQSMGEATHNCVPMVVIPFFADQELNAKKLVTVGVGIRLDFETITAEELVHALKQITENPDYKENIKKYSALTKDQPQSPMERAVWWTEYVLRHNGARHLRSAAADMPWYQYLLLDVMAVLLAGALLTMYLTFITVRKIFRLVFKSKKAKSD